MRRFWLKQRRRDALQHFVSVGNTSLMSSDRVARRSLHLRSLQRDYTQKLFPVTTAHRQLPKQRQTPSWAAVPPFQVNYNCSNVYEQRTDDRETLLIFRFELKDNVTWVRDRVAAITLVFLFPPLLSLRCCDRHIGPGGAAKYKYKPGSEIHEGSSSIIHR